MLTVEMLPAHYGDALLVSWGTDAAPHHILIDGGLASAYPAVARRLRTLNHAIDLLVVSHIDRDHIGGVLKLLADDSLAGMFKSVWFNGRAHAELFSDRLGVLDGERLTDLITQRQIPWNPGWPDPIDDHVGGPVVVRGRPPVKKLRGRAQVRLLSPNPQAIAALSREWERVIKKAGLVVGTPARADPVDETGRTFLGASLTELADTAFEPDNTAANGSSIAFIFEYQGKSILFGADAHSSVLLESLAKITKPGERYPLQACKLPHHGSRRNVPVELVTTLQCSDWWFSTNGVRFAHPSAETVARVLVHGDRPAVLRANYSTVQWDTFTADYPPTTHHPYELLRPTDGAEGLLIQLT